MTPEQTQIARALVASPHFRWMPGVLATSSNNYHRPARIESLDGDTHDFGLTVIPDVDGPVFAAHHEWGVAGTFPRGCSLPDLTDPATVGCLHALACERWGVVAIEVDTGEPCAQWIAIQPDGLEVAYGKIHPAIFSALPDNPHTAACIAALLHEDR
jgi:hypothetical protein